MPPMCSSVSTRLVEWDRVLSNSQGGERPGFPIVVKPRYGAGSQNTFLVNDGDELVRLGRELATGTDLVFRPLGTVGLRGVPGEWELFAASIG